MAVSFQFERFVVFLSIRNIIGLFHPSTWLKQLNIDPAGLTTRSNTTAKALIHFLGGSCQNPKRIY